MQLAEAVISFVISLKYMLITWRMLNVYCNISPKTFQNLFFSRGSMVHLL